MWSNQSSIHNWLDIGGKKSIAPSQFSMDTHILKFSPIVPSRSLVFNSKKPVHIHGVSNTRFRVAAAAGSVQKSEEEWRAILSPTNSGFWGKKAQSMLLYNLYFFYVLFIVTSICIGHTNWFFTWQESREWGV